MQLRVSLWLACIGTGVYGACPPFEIFPDNIFESTFVPEFNKLHGSVVCGGDYWRRAPDIEISANGCLTASSEIPSLLADFVTGACISDSIDMFDDSNGSLMIMHYDGENWSPVYGLGDDVRSLVGDLN